MCVIKFHFTDATGITGMYVLRESQFIPRIGESIYITLNIEENNPKSYQNFLCKVEDVIYIFDHYNTDRIWDMEVVVNYPNKIPNKILPSIMEVRF